MHLFTDPAIEERFGSFPSTQRALLLRLRELILATASGSELPCGVDETLKWGEPSYAPVKARVGSAVRLGSFDGERVAMYFNCQTSLVEQIRSVYGDALQYSKSRAVLFAVAEPLQAETVVACARMAFRYHLDRLGASS